MENSMEFLKKVKMNIPHDPVTPGILPKECAAGYNTAICIPKLLQRYSKAMLWKTPDAP
jgi:hypothetical protein